MEAAEPLPMILQISCRVSPVVTEARLFLILNNDPWTFHRALVAEARRSGLLQREDKGQGKGDSVAQTPKYGNCHNSCRRRLCRRCQTTQRYCTWISRYAGRHSMINRERQMTQPRDICFERRCRSRKGKVLACYLVFSRCRNGVM